MSTDAIRMEVASDGTGKVSRTGAGNEGPRPIDDKELEAVAGGLTFEVTFTDGCSLVVSGNTIDEAILDANTVHEFETGHTNHDANYKLLS